MLIIDKTFHFYTGPLAQTDVVVWRESGFTVAAGIIIDISDVVSDPNVVVSQLSTEFLRNAAKGEISIEEFIASAISLADYPVVNLLESQLIKLDPTPENFAKLDEFMDENSERMQENFKLVTEFLEDLGKA